MSVEHLEEQIRMRARRMRTSMELSLTASARVRGKVPTAAGLVASAHASGAQASTERGTEIGVLLNIRHRHLTAIPAEPEL